MEDKKQKKFSVTFRENRDELELYEWVKEQSKIIGVANFIKQNLYNSMIKDKEGK